MLKPEDQSVPFFDSVENPVRRTSAEQWARRCEAIASFGSLKTILWFLRLVFSLTGRRF
jgi:hypothetical protein